MEQAISVNGSGTILLAKAFLYEIVGGRVFRPFHHCYENESIILDFFPIIENGKNYLSFAYLRYENFGKDVRIALENVIGGVHLHVPDDTIPGLLQERVDFLVAKYQEMLVRT